MNIQNQKLNFILRNLEKDDFNDLEANFGQPSVYKKPINVWDKYLQEQCNNSRLVKVIELNNKIIGICTLKLTSDYKNFSLNNIPEINDLLVAPKNHCQGYGRALVHDLELEAKKLSYERIGLAVGLYADYGSAQRLYANMGYIPDGKGVTYKNQAVIPGDNYPVDDDLLLWLIKKL